MKSSVLAIRLRQLGDVIAVLQALKAIKESACESRLIFMIDENYHDLVRFEEYIDELIPPPPRINSPGSVQSFIRYIEDLRRRRISCVLDFHSNPRSALISFLSGAPRRIGYDVRLRKILYTEVEARARWKDGRKLSLTTQDSTMDLAGRFLRNLKRTKGPPKIRVAEGSYERAANFFKALGTGGDFIGLNPGNPYPAKAWPEESFINLTSMLIAKGKRVMIMCGPGEEHRATRIEKAIGAGAFVSPILSLPDLAGFLKHLSMLVTIDSGLKHLAVSVRLPTITLFGPTSPTEWHMGTLDDNYIYLGYSCSPCRLLTCPFGSPCMSSISPPMVFEKTEAMLAKEQSEGVAINGY